MPRTRHQLIARKLDLRIEDPLISRLPGRPASRLVSPTDNNAIVQMVQRHIESADDEDTETFLHGLLDPNLTRQSKILSRRLTIHLITCSHAPTRLAESSGQSALPSLD